LLAKSKAVEIIVIFISWDNNEEEQNEYYEEMSWASLLYYWNREELFIIHGIPQFVLMNVGWWKDGTSVVFDVECNQLSQFETIKQAKSWSVGVKEGILQWLLHLCMKHWRINEMNAQLN
jgi:hypothetical protein